MLQFGANFRELFFASGSVAGAGPYRTGLKRLLRCCARLPFALDRLRELTNPELRRCQARLGGDRSAAPGRCCSPTFTKYSCSCVAPRSSPSSPTAQPCAASSPTALSQRANCATARRSGPRPATMGPARCGSGPWRCSRPTVPEYEFRPTHRLATTTVDRCGRRQAGARCELPDACATPIPGVARASQRPVITPGSRRSGQVETCYIALQRRDGGLVFLSLQTLRAACLHKANRVAKSFVPRVA